MREVLFRGKRIDNGEWVYGFYVQDLQGGHLILTDEGTWWDGPVLDAIDVIPETVGQYTGLKDKNGQKIFDGDTLHSGEVIGNVVYKDGAFMIRRTNGSGEYKMIIARQAKFEILGNIHDNSELMEPAD